MHGPLHTLYDVRWAMHFNERVPRISATIPNDCIDIGMEFCGVTTTIQD